MTRNHEYRYKENNLLDPATYAAIGERGESVIDKASQHDAVLVELLMSVPGCMDMIMNNRIDYAAKCVSFSNSFSSSPNLQKRMIYLLITKAIG